MMSYTMKNRTAVVVTSLLCTALTGCNTAPRHSEQYLIYSEQITGNQQRLEECSRNQAQHYAASSQFSNDKIARAAWKQCKVYANNYCHATAAREALDREPSQETNDWTEARKQDCLRVLAQATQSALLDHLLEPRE